MTREFGETKFDEGIWKWTGLVGNIGGPLPKNARGTGSCGGSVPETKTGPRVLPLGGGDWMWVIERGAHLCLGAWF